MRYTRLMVVISLGLWLAPVSADAQSLAVFPSVGYSFGGASGALCWFPGACSGIGRVSAGVSARVLFGRFGIEEAVMVHPNILGSNVDVPGTTNLANRVTTTMTHLSF